MKFVICIFNTHHLFNKYQNVHIYIPFGGVFKFNLRVFNMEFQSLVKTKHFWSRSIAIFWKLSEISRFIGKYHL